METKNWQEIKNNVYGKVGTEQEMNWKGILNLLPSDFN